MFGPLSLSRIRAVLLALLSLAGIPPALLGQTTVTASPSSFSSILPSGGYTVTYTVTNNYGGDEDYTFTNGSCLLDTYAATIPSHGSLNISASCTSGAASSSGNFTLRTFGPTTV